MTYVVSEDVWREETPHVLAALLRRSGDFEACEDAVQEALLAAAQQWPRDGAPDHPRAWLVRVASRKLIDEQRTASARAQRERWLGAQTPADALLAPSADSAGASDVDDTLEMLLLCAHPVLSDTSRVALTLRAVAGLRTAQIAAGFLVPEATMAQRISRAKAAIRGTGPVFGSITPDDLPQRVHAVRHVLYLTFTAGHTTSSGDRLIDIDLANEAIHLAERLHAALPDDSETRGLLALLLLTHARADARTDEHGDLMPLDQQDRGRWDAALLARGTRLIEAGLPIGPLGPFQLQGAIAAVHAEAREAADTDWLQITMLYRMLDRAAPSPTVALNLAVAIGWRTVRLPGWLPWRRCWSGRTNNASTVCTRPTPICSSWPVMPAAPGRRTRERRASPRASPSSATSTAGYLAPDNGRHEPREVHTAAGTRARTLTTGRTRGGRGAVRGLHAPPCHVCRAERASLGIPVHPGRFDKTGPRGRLPPPARGAVRPGQERGMRSAG